MNPILVTGAAGILGSHVAKYLHAEQFCVRATDRIPMDNAPFAYQQANLLDHAAVYPLLENVDTVVHFANHPALRHPQQTFNENVAMNMNVFQAAAEQGVRRIVFASTLQLIGSHVDVRTVRHPPAPPAYPLDGATPARPANTDALSKTVSETMLRYFVDRCGLQAVAIRFPYMVRHTRGPDTPPKPIGDNIRREGFTCLSLDDAARLVAAILRADLPGYRTYAPGTSHRYSSEPLPTLIRWHLPDLPDTLDTLIDTSLITAETGWTPSHAETPLHTD